MTTDAHILTGAILGVGVATNPAGSLIRYTIIDPAKQPGNFAVFGTEGKRWQDTAKRFAELANRSEVAPDVARRAEFAKDVLYVSLENARAGVGKVIINQAEDGRILGALAYFPNFGGNEGAINLLAIDAEHLTGSPGTGQLRGLGTALVAAASRHFLKINVQAVYIHPLDDAARKFWASRGFMACGRGGRMCIRGLEAIEKLIDGCQVAGERPDAGEFIMCRWQKEG